MVKATCTTNVFMHAFHIYPINTHPRQSLSSPAMEKNQQQQPVGRQSNVSTTDSAVGLLTHKDQSPARVERKSVKESLYDDLRSYITQKRHHWIANRDLELAHPLQQRFLAFEAELMTEIHDLERERELKHQQRAREMQGSKGIARMSWKLYKLKMKLCGKWMRHRLHGTWKHSRLSAKKKELSEEYVRIQTGKRLEVIREVLWFANEEAVEDGDDGAYVRDGILNYIVTGYDSMFPIARDLEVDMSRR